MGIVPPGPGRVRSCAASTATPCSPTIMARRSKSARICSGATRDMSAGPAALSISRSFFACGSSGMTGSALRFGRDALLVEHDLFRKPVSTFRDHALSPQTGDQSVDGGDRTEVRRRDLALGNLDAEFRFD